jgi:cation:H+ antiporter
MSWLLLVVEFIAGCALLTWGAGRFVKSSTVIAKHYHVPPLVVGMILVGFGTSCPELIVSIFASIKNTPGIAIGNVLGSNIANKALVGGVTALLVPLTIQSRVLFREFPFLIAVTLLVGVMFYSGALTRIDGVILLAIFFGYLSWMFRMAKQPAIAKDILIEEMEHEAPAVTMTIKQAMLWFVFGLVLLLGSAELIVSAATDIALRLGLSNLLVGLTIVAIGTSLPELAATVVSCLRKEYDLAIGNVVGSSLFNMLAVLSMPALINPGPLNRTLIFRDYPVLLAITMLFWLLAVLPPKRGRIGRRGGVLLVLAYVSYIVVLVLSAVS